LHTGLLAELVTIEGAHDRRTKGLARRLARTVSGVIDVI
jgi:hypothetical protein